MWSLFSVQTLLLWILRNDTSGPQAEAGVASTTDSGLSQIDPQDSERAGVQKRLREQMPPRVKSHWISNLAGSHWVQDVLHPVRVHGHHRKRRCCVQGHNAQYFNWEKRLESRPCMGSHTGCILRCAQGKMRSPNIIFLAVLLALCLATGVQGEAGFVTQEQLQVGL